MEKLHHGLSDFHQAYGVDLPKDALQRAMESMVDARQRVDFGRLNEDLQRKVIEHVIEHGSNDQVIMETESAHANASLWLEAWFSEGALKPDYNAMLAAINRHYGVDVCADRLKACYDALLSAEISPQGDEANAVSQGLLSSFVVPERFNFLRT